MVEFYPVSKYTDWIVHEIQSYYFWEAWHSHKYLNTQLLGLPRNQSNTGHFRSNSTLMIIKSNLITIVWQLWMSNTVAFREPQPSKEEIVLLENVFPVSITLLTIEISVSALNLILIQTQKGRDFYMPTICLHFKGMLISLLMSLPVTGKRMWRMLRKNP